MLEESYDNQGGDRDSLFRPHYSHQYVSVFSSRQGEITGEPGKEDLRPERLVWGMNDWSGGENNRSFDRNDPTVYDFSYGAHGRVRSQIQSRPNRARTVTNLGTDDETARPAMAVGNSAVWVGQGKRIAYSTNGTSWTQYTAAQTGLNALNTNYRITAVAGDGENFYYAGWHSGSSGSRVLMSATTSAAGTTVESEATSKAPFAGLATLNGRLYCWTGRKLHEFDVFQSFPLAAGYRRKVGDSGIDPVSTNVFGTSWWANCVAAESSIFTFYSQDGQSTVYEFAVDGGFGPIWSGPFGFTIKSMKYINGILYFGGHEGGDSNAKGRGMMWAMPLRSREPVFIGHFRKQNNLNLEMQEMAGAYGNTIMIAAARTGRIFIYDADHDAISNFDMLDTVSGGSAQIETSSNGLTDTGPLITNTDGLVFQSNADRIGDMITWGTKRLVCVYAPGSTGNAVQMLSYDDDEPTNRQKGTATGSSVNKIDSGDYDFGLPFDRKVLLGFDLITDPLTGAAGARQVQVQYSIDGAAFVTAGSLDGTSTNASNGRFYVTVSTSSSTVYFSRIRVRLILTGTNGNYPPIVYNVATEAQLVTYEELWQLIVRLKDEQNDAAGSRNRPSSRKVKGQTARDFLWTTAQAKQVVAFLDGYRYKMPNPSPPSGLSPQPSAAGYTTHTVVIEQAEDIITRVGEGAMKLVLRAVPN